MPTVRSPPPTTFVVEFLELASVLALFLHRTTAVCSSIRPVFLLPTRKSPPLGSNFPCILAWICLILCNASFTTEVHRAFVCFHTDSQVNGLIHHRTHDKLSVDARRT